MKKEERVLAFIIFILLMNMANANILVGRNIPFVIGLIFLFRHIKANSFVFGKSFLILVGLWILINLVSMIVNNVSFSFFRLLINTIRLLFLPYLLLYIYGKSFWITFEKVIFFLTKISLLIFIINIAQPSLFNSLQSLFKIFTTQGLMVNHGYWSAFVYVNAFADNGYGFLRYNGFMWEPGAMAMIIIWAMIHNSINNGFQFDKRFMIYFVALIVTFSTAGYMAFVFILFAKYLKKITIVNFFIILIFSIAIYFSYSRLEFISGKLNSYTEEFNEDKLGENGNMETKINRFQAFGAVLVRILDQPFGYGLVSANDIDDFEYSAGVNGLASLLEMWGIPVFIYFLFQFYRYIRWLDVNSKLNKLGIFLSAIALLIPIASNPSERMILVYLIILSSIVCNLNVIKTINEQ